MEEHASQKQLECLVGRAVINAEFREKLLSHPQEAAAELGVELTEEQILLFEQVDAAALEELAKQAEDLFRISAAAPGW
ncbi:MAG: hypothetical protein JSV37_06750 [Anaerolineaceae bacterium]|nr:MAG: hypothetical protein JSV37_06750 [Anaerolineaceae bacterium]